MNAMWKRLAWLTPMILALALAVVPSHSQTDSFELPDVEDDPARRTGNWGDVAVTAGGGVTRSWSVQDSRVEFNLPWDAAVQLRYSPSAGVVSAIRSVSWSGPVNSDNAGDHAAELLLPGPGEYRVVLHVEVRGDPALGLREASHELEVVIQALDVPSADVKAVMIYPGRDRTPPVDLNGDHMVDESDLLRFWDGYGQDRGNPGFVEANDWTGDGHVGIRDLVDYMDAYSSWNLPSGVPSYGGGVVYPVSGLPRASYAFEVPSPHFQAKTDPPGLESWLEWTLDGESIGEGRVISTSFTEPGSHRLEVNLFGHPQPYTARELTIFETEIVSHVASDAIEDDVTHDFVARTDPPGYEKYVVWYASTLYGKADPPHGRGPEFSVVFRDTWGPGMDDPSQPFRWIGIQADNAYLDVDAKCCLATAPAGCQNCAGAPANTLAVNKLPLLAGDCSPGECGITFATAGAIATNITACFDAASCTWKFEVSASRGLRSGHCYGQNGITDICDSTSTDITKANFCSLVDGFHNGGSGDGGGDCFVTGGTTYGCSSITVTHENTHVQEMRDALAAEVALLAARPSMQPLAVTCPDMDTCAKAVAARNAAISADVALHYAAANATWLPIPETGPWASEFPAATDLAKKVCERARDEAGWDVDGCAQCVTFGYTD